MPSRPRSPHRWIPSYAARAATLCAVAVVLAAVGLARTWDAPEASPVLSPVDLLVTQVPASIETAALRRAAAGGTLPPGTRIVRLTDDAGQATNAAVLTAGFSSAGRPDVSFDGTRMLFVGRKEPADLTALWEMEFKTGDVRRVIECPRECSAAWYSSSIYTLDAQAPVHQFAFLTSPAEGEPPAIFTCLPDGTGLRRITFNPAGVIDAHLLLDGRLVVAAVENQPGSTGADSTGAGEPFPASEFLSVFPDGTDLFPFAAVHASPAHRRAMVDVSPWKVAFLEMAGDHGDTLTRVVRADRRYSLRPGEIIAERKDSKCVSLAPVNEGFVAACTDPNRPTLDLVRIPPGRHENLLLSDAWHELDVTVLRPRTEPAGRSSVVRDELEHAELYCIDSYITDRGHQPAFQPGSLKQVRLNAMGAGGPELLGLAPVEPDGSFFVRVPAKLPLQLELLDSEGHVAGTSSWIWAMPGERRGCIGCHEDRERTPPNRHPLALRKPPVGIGEHAVD